MKETILSICIAVLLLIVVFSGCEEKNNNTSTIKIPESLIITRRYVNGFYQQEDNLTITGDGQVNYFAFCGLCFDKGDFGFKKGNITPEDLSKLITLFEENKFFDLNNTYASNLTDAGATSYYYKDDYREKSVVFGGGSEKMSLVNSIDEALNAIIDRLPFTSESSFLGSWAFDFPGNGTCYFSLDGNYSVYGINWSNVYPLPNHSMKGTYKIVDGTLGLKDKNSNETIFYNYSFSNDNKTLILNPVENLTISWVLNWKSYLTIEEVLK